MILISFLGTAKYKECNYDFRDKIIASQFFSVALNKYFEPDEIYLCLTNEAFKINGEEIASLMTYKKINIPSGKSEDELWEIANIIIDKIPENSEVILDITYGFRALPLFGAAILIYLREVKKITIKGIYYGAFEAKNINGLVPVFNLSTTLDLIEWSFSAIEFLKYGNAGRIKSILKKIQMQSHLDKNILKPDKISKSASNIDNFMRAFSLLNLKESNKCIKLLVSNSTEAINELLQIKKIKPFETLYKDIIEKFSRIQFNESNNENLIESQIALIDWFISTNHFQQAVTLLIEMFVSYYCLKENKNPFIRKDRSIIATKLRNDKNKSIILNKLSELRNEINHAGMREKETPSDTKVKKIKMLYNEVLNFINNSSNNYIIEKEKGILINLSNHPSTAWQEDQLKAALSDYTNIVDIPFPVINPDLTTAEIEIIASNYFTDCFKILDIEKDNTIHIMGELTFCYKFIDLMKSKGVKCIASTTKRESYIDESGNKISKFEFVQFREY